MLLQIRQHLLTKLQRQLVQVRLEVATTGNPARNLPEAQGEMSQVAKESQAKAGSKDSALPVEVSSADLDKRSC